MGGRAKVAAEKMIGHISSMTLEQLSELVEKKDEAVKFLKTFEKHKNDFLKTVEAQAKLDQIEKLLAAAKSDRQSAAAEIEQAQTRAKQMENEAASARSDAKQAISEAEARAAKIVNDAERAAGNTRKSIQAAQKAAESERRKAEDELERAKNDRQAAAKIKAELAEKRKRAEALLREL